MAIKVTGNIVISDSQAISNITTFDANGNVTTTGNFIGIFANGNSNISIPAANGNINLSAGGTPNELVITSTGINVAGTIDATGNITGNFFIGNGSQLTGISASFPLANGTSNINIPTSSGNINFSIGGSANEIVMTSTGANVNGYLTVTGNITGGIVSNSTNVYSTASNQYPIGYRQMPQNSQSGGSYTLVLDDDGKSIYLTGTTTCTVTIPTNSAQAYAIGTVISLINNNSGILTINSSATLQLANGTSGNRSVASKGMVTCIKTATDTWYVIGAGVT